MKGHCELGNEKADSGEKKTTLLQSAYINTLSPTVGKNYFNKCNAIKSGKKVKQKSSFLKGKFFRSIQ